MKFTLGIDIGTYAAKGVLVDARGQIIASANTPHEMIVPQPGWAEHRADQDWWGDFVTIARRIVQMSGVDPRHIACVAASAIGPCMLPVDADGHPLMNGVLYGVDTRAAREIGELTDRLGGDVIMRRCGNALTTQSVGPKILWLRRNRPAIFARTARILTSTSYLVFRLTGEYVIDHYSAAGFTPLYDVKTRDWAADLAADLVSPEMLPRLLWSTAIAGHVTAAAARETGLAEGTPVTCGTIDAAAEAISVGLRQSGDMMIMYGSTVFMIALTDARIGDPRLWYAPWLFEGEHVAMAGLATSGTLAHWFRDQLARDLPRDTAFDVLTAEAQASPPGAKGLIALPYFSGERTPIHDPLARGAFFGLNLTHNRGDMYRALLEGIAFGTGHVIETFRQIGEAPQRVLAVGGGTKNGVWLQATSDIAGVRQIISQTSAGACFGNAFLAAVAVGHARREEIGQWNPVVQTIEPKVRAVYARQNRLFRTLYQQTREIAHELGSAP